MVELIKTVKLYYPYEKGMDSHDYWNYLSTAFREELKKGRYLQRSSEKELNIFPYLGLSFISLEQDCEIEDILI